MNLIEFQILASICSIIGVSFLVFKKRVGWLFNIGTMSFFILINYSIGLWILIIPTSLALVIAISGWLRWGRK